MSATLLKRRHSELCYRRAFPRSTSEILDVSRELDNYGREIARQPAAIRQSLADSGIAETSVHYCFSFDVARWLAKTAPGAVAIDWEALEDHELLDDLLRHILQPSEDEYFDSGYASTRDWIRKASAGSRGTDFDWLMAQLRDRRFQSFYRQLYDAIDLPLVQYNYSQTRGAAKRRHAYAPAPRQERNYEAGCQDIPPGRSTRR
jgi:hypothetical protein